LDYFDLKSLDELPNLAELKDLDELRARLDLEQTDQEPKAQQESVPSQSENTDKDHVSDPAVTESAVIMTLPGTETQH
jgi:segregation and condensation protein B